MIHVYATAKLRKKLPLDKQGLLPDAESWPAEPKLPFNPLSSWHAHLVHLQRRQCVVMVHDVSRFALFLPCLKKPDFAQLDLHFQDVLINTLLKTKLPANTVESATKFLEPLCFEHKLRRSVQGTLNQLVMDIDHKLWFDRLNVADLLPYSTSAWLSDRPCMIKAQKECIWPIKSIQQLLETPILVH